MPIDISNLDIYRAKRAFICDMDGVLYHGNRLLPGAISFVEWLRRERKEFLFLTNSSERTPRELREKLRRLGIDAEDRHFYTSALATAAFLASQKERGTAYVIGQPGLISALYDVGYSMNDSDPDFVIVGETPEYGYARIVRAIRHVLNGAKLIGTNPDLTGPAEDGIVPATGALMAPIEMATNARAYYVGKPNPLIMRHALKKLGVRREETVIVGDRMDTDIVAGIEAEIATILVLSGVTGEREMRRFAYRPDCVLAGVGDIAG